jgi:DNA-binding CsgD family transcriptional regulator
VVLVDNALVGRRAELDTLDALIDRSARGGRGVFIEGEAGIGKSRLLHAALGMAHERGLRVFSAAADELETRRPFGVLADCLRIQSTLGDALWSADGGEWSASEAGAEFRIVEDLVALVDDLTIDGPAVLALDDLQWADPSSLIVLHRLIRQLPRMPLLLLAAARPLPRQPELASLLRELPSDTVTRLRLGPMQPDEWPAIVEAVLRAPPGSRLLELVAGAGGNPLFIAEVVGGLKDAGAVQIEAQGHAETSATAPPANVTAAILQRLSFLTGETLHLLGLASILGGSFLVGELSLLAGEPVAGLVTRLREALRAGVLQEQETRLAFRHQLIREALYADLPLAVRTGLHGDLWRRLAASGAPAIQVAEHITRASSLGDREAVSWLRRAAHEVGPLAPALAVDLLRRALELTDPSNADRARLLPDLAVSLIWAGQLHDGEDTCRQALAQPGGVDGESWLRLCLAQAFVLLDRAPEAAREAELAAAAASASASERVRAVAWGSLAQLYAGDLSGAVARAEAARFEAERLGDAPAWCQALGTLSLAADVRARFGEAAELATLAAGRAERDSTREAHRSLPHLVLGRALADLDRLDDAEESIRRGREVCERLGARGAMPSHHFTAALCWFAAGNWDDALAEIEVGLELAEEMGIGWRTPAYATAALIAIHRDELRVAEQWLGRLQADARVPGWRYQLDRVQWARALLLEAGGRLKEAVESLGSAWDGCERAGLLVELPLLGPDLVRLAMRVGDPARAEQTAAAVSAVGGCNPGVAWVAGAALRCAGTAAGDVEQLLQAVAVYRDGPRPLERAQACEDAGQLLFREGELDAGRALFEEAQALYARLHAARDLRRVRASMRAAGLRQGPRARHRPKHGWQALTDTELTVVRLVAERLSNPEIAQRLFLSRRTVQTHVSHALAKLEMHSRLELAAEAQRRGGGLSQAVARCEWATRSTAAPRLEIS